MNDRQDLARHLSVYVDLGVAGVSRDRAWRERGRDTASDGGRTFRSGADAGSKDPASIRTDPASIGTDPASIGTDPVSGLQQLRDEIGPYCTRCKLHGLGRKQVVFGVGNP